jgi:hypothetical protein
MARSSKPLARVSPSRYGLKRFGIRFGCSHHLRMRAYSLDSKRKVVEPVIRGRPKAEPARSFGIGVPTLKRYVGKAHKGEDMVPRKPPGKRRKPHEGAMKLLESDLRERPRCLPLARGAAFWSELSGRR